MAIYSHFINKWCRKWHNIQTWRRHSNHTFFHFEGNALVAVDGVETHGVPHVEIYDDHAHLSIGRYCSIAGGCQIVLGGNHHTDWVSTYGWYQEPQWFPKFADLGLENSTRRGDIVIGNDVWIGRNVTILPGAHISDGCVIGAGSVVAGFTPPIVFVSAARANLAVCALQTLKSRL